MQNLDDVAKLLVLQGIKKLASDADDNRLLKKKTPLAPVDDETSDGTPVDEEALQEAVTEGVSPEDLPDPDAAGEPDGDEGVDMEGMTDETEPPMEEDDGDDDMAKLRKKKASMK